MSGIVSKVKSFINSLLFTDVTSLVRHGKKKHLELEDFHQLPQELQPKKYSEKFLDLPLTNVRSFLWGVFKAQSHYIKVMIVLYLMIVILQLSSPVLIHKLVTYVQSAAEGHSSLNIGILTALGLAFVNILEGLVSQHYFFWGLKSEQFGINGINYRIYDKALKLTREGRQKRPVGDVVNYLGFDTNLLAEFSWMCVELIFSVLTIFLVIGMLYYLLGVAALASIVVLVALLPIVKMIGKRFMQYDEELKDYRDERVSLTSQIVSGIRIVKYFAWEKLFLKDVSALRDREIQSLKKLVKAESISISLYMMANTLVSLVTFAVYVSLGNKLDAATVFSAMALFGLLEHPFGGLTHFLSQLFSGKVSAERIMGFLSEDELEKSSSNLSERNKPIGVQLENVSIQYHDGNEPVLKELTLSIAEGESVAIVGPVGSGKTSLLLVLMNELPFEGEKKFTNLEIGQEPRMAWIPQEAFIRNSSLKDNILFGEQPHLYQEAVHVTALQKDFREFVAGDQTEIGEQGINISGGQKQRVSLARAVMAEPGIVLLDDPLSAVDVATEKYLVDNLIFGQWSGITRVVVTHRLEHLHCFDKVVFIENGQIRDVGNFAHLFTHSPRFLEFYREHERSHGDGSHELDQEHVEVEKKEKVFKPDQDGKLIEDEDREKGAVGLSVYWQFLQAMAGGTKVPRTLMLIILLLLSSAVTFLPILQNTWLSVWTEKNESQSWFLSLFSRLKGDEYQNLMIFGVFATMVIGVFSLQHVVWAFSSIRAGKSLHDKALFSVLKAKVRFFDTTPVGRVLNRFSSDVQAIESQLAWSFNHSVRALFGVIGSVIVIFAVLPIMILVIVPLMGLYYYLQNSYRISSREAQRIWSITKSPRFAHFKETLEGISVIRGMKKEELFREKFYETLEENQKAFYGMVVLNRWFTIRISLLGGFMSSAVAMALIWIARSGVISASLAGLALLYSLGLWQRLSWLIRSFSQAESNLTSVERVGAFQKLEPEMDLVKDASLQDGERWPLFGGIEYGNVYASYANELPNVLKGVSFRINPGEKVGVIGRTGSGKSTIFQTLFRLIPVNQGFILIDGKDIGGIQLETLRRSLAIIPQDPTLFVGTLRSNLDRFHLYSDDEIWKSLERVQLKSQILSFGQGLNYRVVEGGKNFSQGQRQLLCLARALLMECKIIVMDEATASVDVETDMIIQETIKKECQHQTVILIAHRLGTVADCDKVIEMEDGKVKRISQGANLQKNKIPQRSSVNFSDFKIEDELVH